MEILRYPHANLFKKCKEVTVFGDELSILLNAMKDAMLANNGMGLAANQIGLNYRMFVMLNRYGNCVFLVNPEIIEKSAASANIEEGCLSAPGEFVILSERRDWVTVKYQNESGDMRQTSFGDIFAVCVQHEIDHLNGKSHLESKSIKKEKRKEFAKKWGLK